MRIKVCLNGGRRRGDHPALPVTPEELAAAAAAAVAEGAFAVHAHPRGADGAETLDPAGIGAAVAAVRAACPGVGVGVSTGLWICEGDADERSRLIASWAGLTAEERPDFASVNLGEPGFTGLAEQLLDLGIGVEAGVWSVGDAEKLAATGLGDGCVRFLVELIGVPPDKAPALADRILAALAPTAPGVPRLLHGEEASTWPMIALAARRGLDTRIGLEDTLTGPDGEPVAGNAGLVRLARGV